MPTTADLSDDALLRALRNVHARLVSPTGSWKGAEAAMLYGAELSAEAARRGLLPR
jgi:hypothetical protein